MQVKNRLFPYPVINHNQILSNFGASDFQLLYEGEENDNAYVLKNARFLTESNLINSGAVFFKTAPFFYGGIEMSFSGLLHENK